MSWSPLKPRIEKIAGAPGASPPVTPTAAFATSVVVRMPWSCMVCWLMTSTVAGVSRAEMPRREETSVTAAVFSGVSTGPLAGWVIGLATTVAAGLRPVTRRAVRGF